MPASPYYILPDNLSIVANSSSTLIAASSSVNTENVPDSGRPAHLNSIDVSPSSVVPHPTGAGELASNSPVRPSLKLELDVFFCIVII
ncbi:hypothetical protein APHAL10511_005817, partial [Amanita phalloides]